MHAHERLGIAARFTAFDAVINGFVVLMLTCADAYCLFCACVNAFLGDFVCVCLCIYVCGIHVVVLVVVVILARVHAIDGGCFLLQRRGG
jgi:hypothetical protein